MSLNFALKNSEKMKGIRNVKPNYIKKISRKLENLLERFNSDFENNKRMVDGLTDVNSTRMGNRVSGYVTRLVNANLDQKNVEKN